MNKNFLIVFSLLFILLVSVKTQAQMPFHGGDSTSTVDTTRMMPPPDGHLPDSTTVIDSSKVDSLGIHHSGPTVVSKVKGTISGIITSDVDGLPIAGARVQLLSEVAHNGHCAGAGKVISADSTGSFSASVDTGTYIIRFSAKGYISEFFDNASSVETATKVAVAESTVVTASAALAPYVAPTSYSLQGTVKDASGNALQARISVFKLQSNTFHVDKADAKTDSLGTFSAKVNNGDTIVVFAQPADHRYAAEYYNDQKDFASAERIAVNGNITGIDIVLDLKPVLPNGISGIIADSVGTGVSAHVKAIKVETNKHGNKYATVSDSLGTYSLTNLTPGTYILEAIPERGYAATFFKYDGSTTLDKSLADSVVVDSVTVVTGINFTVKALTDSGLATISGTIRNQANTPVSDAIVYAINSSNKIASYAIVSSNGKYIINNLLPGTYTVATSASDYTASSNPSVALNYTTSAYKTTAITVTNTATTDVSNEKTVVSGFSLSQNYPNPFNPSTVIKFSLPEKMNAKLTVYDMMGREVAQLINGVTEAGTHSVEFKASGLASGIYFYTLTANNLSLTHKFVLLK